ncbi:MAG: hypothetical protein EZS26_002869 [Candidatus Ordinivivax streblomastigis]|uniref:Uncharacterized protein n=1 Tax=Candidatus Ordinivivax streblomastigis TaxID=2540710 RepID=A0A5M8NX02_9BACT|nr:MAG: hypothetical protein EZS26_002869 [Candidatus Ordinivivax streblomastigis]
MNHQLKNLWHWILLPLAFYPCQNSPAQINYLDFSKGDALRLSNRYYPEFGVIEMSEQDFGTDHYKSVIDEANAQTPYNFLIPFLRFPHYEVVDTMVHGYVKRTAEYAAKQNVQLVPDLDVRNARRAFQVKHPDELQQMLRLKETVLLPAEATGIVIPSIDLNDHYSGGQITHHISLKGSLLRVYVYQKTAEGIDLQTLRDITEECEAVANADSVMVKVPSQKMLTNAQAYACVMVAFTHLYPDIFAPHLIAFQRGIIEQYRDVPLIGVCKDEWGFPPYYPRFFHQGMYDFWYSPHRAKAYSDSTGGRELLADCLLMAIGEQGREGERLMAVNRFMDMNRLRNTALEEDFYQTVKTVFGKDAVVSVHSTWWPYPDRCEYLKNGLDWWTTKRDWAQTDEVAPYAVRTALCKKWGSAIWYNMYYKADVATQAWSSVLGGGRIDYLSYQSLWNIDPELMKGECRIRLLNCISKSPLDCRIAVVFGHASATNWVGPYFEDTGMALVDSLWHTGYPTDLIPTTEITNGSLKTDADGTIRYGEQVYTAVVLYHPEYENRSVADFFTKAAHGKTRLLRVGDWTKDFYGKPLDGNHLLPASMTVANETQDAFAQVLQILTEQAIEKQSPATEVLDNTYFRLRDFTHVSYAPPTTGFCRMIDGTVILAAGSKQASGDLIQKEFQINQSTAFVDAVGIAAARLDENGDLEALAAGGLKSFKVNRFELNLNERADIALWKNENGKWQGVLQGWKGDIPEELLKFTADWSRLEIPVPPKLISAD